MYRGTGILIHSQIFDNLQVGDTYHDADYGPMIWSGTRWHSDDGGHVVDPRIGDLVHYVPFEGCEPDLIENGRIKMMADYPLHLFVVYHCNDEWENYTDYTAALTHIKQLKYGWFKNSTKNVQEQI